MKKILVGFALLAAFNSNSAFAEGRKVSIQKPLDGENVTVPFEICFTATGLEATKAGKKNEEGKGHHHVLIDVDPVKDAFEPNSKELNKYGKGMLLHMFKGEKCFNMDKPLTPGKHKISDVFSHNNHVPYEPIISDTVTVNVVPQFDKAAKK